MECWSIARNTLKEKSCIRCMWDFLLFTMIFTKMSEQKFKILSIDGGGMRGIIPAKILCELEEELQRREGPDARLCDYFDLICGTSTGGIIAIGLALGISAKDILDLYVKHGKEIFSHKWIRFLIKGRFYDQCVLKKFLTEAYKDSRIDDCRTRICIPTYDLYRGTIHVLKTRHHERLSQDYHIPAVDAALSTSAAPVYFHPYTFRYTNIDSDNMNSAFHHVDGGVFANNPALIGITEAHSCLNVPLEDVELLSLGTGEILLKEIKPNKRMRAGYWLNPIGYEGLRLYELVASSQSINIHNTLTMLQKGIGKSEEKRFTYIRIQPALDRKIDLDATDDESLEVLMHIGQELYKLNDTDLKSFIATRVQQYERS